MITTIALAHGDFEFQRLTKTSLSKKVMDEFNPSCPYSIPDATANRWLVYSAACLTVGLLLTGCGDAKSTVNGSVYVVTKGQQVVKMAGVTVLALNEVDLAQAMQECNAQLASEFPQYQNRLHKNTASGVTKDIALAQNKQQLEATIASTDNEMRQINLDIRQKYGAAMSAIQKTISAEYLSSSDDSRYVETCKNVLKGLMVWAANQLKESQQPTLYGQPAPEEDKRLGQQKYQQALAFYQSVFPAVEAAERQLVALQKAKDDLSEQQNRTLWDSGTAVKYAESEATKVENEWIERQARIAFRKAFSGGKENRAFYTTTTDADGRFSFILPKEGSYVFVAFGNRQVFDETEEYFWVRHGQMKCGYTYTYDFNNDAIVPDEYKAGQDMQLLYLMKREYGLEAPELK